MTPMSQRSKLYWAFKIGGVFVSCLLPVWTICEKFPVWKAEHGVDHSVGVCSILILSVLIIVFRKAVFQFLADRLKINHAPPITIWIVLLIVCYVMLFIANFLRDLTTILWMGCIGCAVGTFLTFIAENRFGKKEHNDGRHGQ